MPIGTLLKSEIPQYQLKLPLSGKEITFRPYRVKEEKVLLLALEQNSEKAVLNSIKNLIENCVEEIDDAGELPIGDLEYLFINMRAKSVGEKVKPNIICPITNKQIAIEIDLTSIAMDKQVPKNKIKISKGVGVTIKYPSLNSLAKAKVKDYSKVTDVENLFSIICACIEEVWTNDEVYLASEIPFNEMKDFIESMSVPQFEKLVKYFDNCPVLTKTIKYKVPVDPERDENDEPLPEENEIVLKGITDFFV